MQPSADRRRWPFTQSRCAARRNAVPCGRGLPNSRKDSTMKRKDKLLPHLLPMTLAAALVAGPVLAQSPGSAGGASGNTGATGADSRPSTAQGATGTTTPGTTATTPGTTTATPGTTATTMGDWPAGSVVMHRPRLSQLIGTNVYNDRNETIGEVDDIILATPPGMGTMRSGTTMGTAPSATAPGGSASTATAPSGTTAGTTPPGMMAGTAGTGAMHGPMAVIQVGGFLGMGGRLVAVPLSELQWNAERERIIMPNASKETLQGRPAFSYDTLRRG